MFCTNCGKENADGMSFCVNCGMRLNTQPQGNAQPQSDVQQPDYEQPNVYQQGYQPNVGQQQDYQPNFGNFNANQVGNKIKNLINQKGRTPIIGGALVAVIVLIIIICSACTRSMGATVNLLEKAINKQDARMMIDAVMPKKALKRAAKEMDMSRREFEEFLEDECEDTIDDLDLDGEKIKIKLTDKGDKVSRRDLKELNESLEEMGIKAEQAREDVEITIKYDGEKEEVTCTMYKVGGKWYINPLW